MTRSELSALVIRELAAIASDRDPSSIGEGEDVRDALDMDSLDVLRFVQALHKALGVDIPEADYRKIVTVRGCVDYLASRLAEAGSNAAGSAT